MSSANGFTTGSESFNPAPAWSIPPQHINPQDAFGTTDLTSWPNSEPPSYPGFEGSGSANIHLGQLTPPNDDSNEKDRNNAQAGYEGNEDHGTHHTGDDDQQDDSDVEATSKKRKGRPKDPKSVKRRKSDVVTQEDESKRKKFLERNRQAASKCRQKKRAYNEKLEGKCREMMRENVNLRTILVQLKDEVLNLQNLALEHGNMGCQEVAAHMTGKLGLGTESTQAPVSSSIGHGQSVVFPSNGQGSSFPSRHDSLMQSSNSGSTDSNQAKLSLIEQYNRNVGNPQQSPVQASHHLSHVHHHRQPAYAAASQHQSRAPTPPKVARDDAAQPYTSRSPPVSRRPSQQKVHGLPGSSAFGSDRVLIKYPESVATEDEQDRQFSFAC